MSANDDAVNKAAFYPNLGTLVRAKILEQPEVNVTCDILTSFSVEQRHFIDKNYLESIAPHWMTKLARPTPPCSILIMNGPHQTAVGMLPMRVSVMIYLANEAQLLDDEDPWNNPPKQTIGKGWLQVKLQNVLVIDALPVPLHLSFRALKLDPTVTMIGGSFGPEDFPPTFRSHAYWESRTMFMPSLGMDSEQEEAIAERNELGRTGRANKVKTRGCCKHCGSKASEICSICRNVGYCGAKCQKADWANHRKQCKR